MKVQETKVPLLVDARQAARMLSVSARKLWSMTFEDQPGLPYVRLGRLIRYRPGALADWLAAKEEGGLS